MSVNPFSITPPKRVIQDNRRGLFHDMVFYIHNSGIQYKGANWKRTKTEQDILTNGGKIITSILDLTLTHILIPPDKLEKNRNNALSSLLNLNLNYNYNIYGSDADSKNIDYSPENIRNLILEVKDWDIPNLVRFFSGHVNEFGEDIREIYKPVLRFDWIFRCVKAKKVLGEDDEDWNGQIISENVSKYSNPYKPDCRSIRPIEMSGERVSNEHRDFARAMSSGSGLSTSYPARPQLPISRSYQPRSNSHIQTPHNSNSSAYVPRPTQTRPSSHNFLPDLSLPRPSRWANLHKALTLQSPALPPDTDQLHQSLIIQVQTPNYGNTTSLPLETFLPMTPESSKDSFDPAPHDSSDNKKRSRSITPEKTLPVDPRFPFKKLRLNSPTPERMATYPPSDRTQTIETQTPPIYGSQTQLLTPPSIERSYSPTSCLNNRPNSTPIMRRSESITPSVVSTAFMRSRTAHHQQDMIRLFVSNGRPMTFWVPEGHFQTEFCIKASGGIIHPQLYAQIIIFPRSPPGSNQQPKPTIEEEKILEQIESEGFQTALSSQWVDACLKAQELVPEEGYMITRVFEQMSSDGIHRVEHPINTDSDSDYDDDVVFMGSTVGLPVETTAVFTKSRMKVEVQQERSITSVETLFPFGSESSREPSPNMPAVSNTSIQPMMDKTGANHRSTSADPDLKPELKPKAKLSTSYSKFISQSISPKSQEVNQLVNFLVNEMRDWNPNQISRNQFFTQLTQKYPERIWSKFFFRHQAKIMARFKEMGLTYPGQVDDDVLDELNSD